jgi:hypothetical protein
VPGEAAIVAIGALALGSAPGGVRTSSKGFGGGLGERCECTLPGDACRICIKTGAGYRHAASGSYGSIEAGGCGDGDVTAILALPRVMVRRISCAVSTSTSMGSVPLPPNALDRAATSMLPLVALRSSELHRRRSAHTTAAITSKPTAKPPPPAMATIRTV